MLPHPKYVPRQKNIMKTREITYKLFTIVQTVEWVKNPKDGDGDEVKTTIKELPEFNEFNQMQWLRPEQITTRIEDAIDSAKRRIDRELKEQEPTLYDDLGFK